jgi:hypothetical protein
MSTKGPVYEVTMIGEYYAYANGRKSQKPYTFKFKASDVARKQGLCSVFKNAMRPKDGRDNTISKMFKKQYPDFKAIRKHIVDNVVNLTEKNKPVQELALWNRAQIVSYIDKTGLPIDADLYPVVTDLRQALKDYNENPEAFEKMQEKRRASKGPELAVMRDLDALNEDPGDLPPGDEKEPLVGAPALEYPDDVDPLDDELRLPEFDDQRELDALLSGL